MKTETVRKLKREKNEVKYKMVKKKLVAYMLYPLSLLYGAVVFIRNKFYDKGILKSHKFDSVICVGNITVGGTGKTPHIEYLLSLLGKQHKIAVVSRGYKRKSKGFRYVDVNDTSSNSGDEPLQIKKKFPNAIVAVDANRINAIHKIKNDYHDVDIILLDDAFQYRKVTASINILLIDYNRPVWNDLMLPAGRLRDCRSNIRRSDIIIVTKCPENITNDDKEKCIKQLAKYGKQVYFSHSTMGKEISLNNNVFMPSKIYAFAGIANPQPFFEEIHTRYPNLHIEQQIFPDHHNFTEKEIKTIAKKAKTHTIVTTEKDFVRLNSYIENMFYVPITVTISNSGKFNDEITQQL